MWGLKKIEADKAWGISQGQGVVVAVIDTGVDYTHPDLRDNMWVNSGEIPNNNKDDDQNGYVDDIYGYDFRDNDPDPMDSNDYHGTHVAGTIAALGNNNIGVIGVAPQAKIMAIRGLRGADMARCVRYAVDNRAQVLNNSWVRYGESYLIADAFSYAYSRGCISVAGAGNDNKNVSFFTPANLDTVIAVAASDYRDEKASFSNYGNKIDVSAPGEEILSTVPPLKPGTFRIGGPRVIDKSYGVQSGTSMACPHVAGVAALILSRNLFLRPEEQVRQILSLSADDRGERGKDIYFGYGRVNAYKSALLAQEVVKIGITSFINNNFVRGNVEILGSAFIGDKFQSYQLYYAPKDNFENTSLISSSTRPVEKGRLALWDTTRCTDGEYWLTLKVIATDGKEIIYDRGRVRDIVVDNINQAPAFVGLTNKEAIVGQRLEFKVEAKDPDDPGHPNGRLKYSAKDLPPGAAFDPNTQIFSWQPTQKEKNTYSVSFTVEDSEYTITQEVLISATSGLSTPLVAGYSPAIYGDKIVFSGRDDNKLHIYSLTEKKDSLINESNWGDSSSAIYGDKIVWKDRNLGGIVMYDYTTNIKTQISDGLSAITPAIYENKIVWADRRNGNQDIYLYDLVSKQETQITNHPADQQSPAIYQDKIIWQDRRNGNWDIYMYDLTTKQETPIITRSVDQVDPAIYGNKIVWQENIDIHLYDLLTHTETKLASSNYYDSYSAPAIYKNIVIWERYYDYQTHIYIMDISPSTPRIDSISREQRVRSPSGNRLITILGKNFGSTQEGSKLELADGRALPVESWSDSSITFELGYTRSYSLSVVIPGGRSNWINIDNTPPSQSTVTDDGISTNSPYQLHVNCSSADAESGIAEYQYRITQDSISGRVVKDWGPVGTNTSITVRGLNLGEGKTYYFAVKAKNGAGLFSSVGYSDGITVISKGTLSGTVYEIRRSCGWQGKGWRRSWKCSDSTLPLSGAMVIVRGADGLTSGITKTTITASNGSYTIADLPQGNYTVTASTVGPNCADCPKTPISISAGTTTRKDFSIRR